MDIHETIEDIFKRNSKRIFLVEPATGSLTYKDFFNLACHASGMLRELGLKEGSRVGVLLNNSKEYAALYFAALFCGVAIVPINQALSKKEIHFLLENSALDLLVFSMCTRPLVMEAGGSHKFKKVCILEGQEKTFHPEVTEIGSLDEFPDPRSTGWSPKISADQTIAVVYTSGTTGLPKGIMHRTRTYIEAALAFNKNMEFGPENRFINHWPMAYNTGWLNTLLCPFLCEGSVVIMNVYDAKTPLNFWRPVIEHKANTFWLSPTMMAALNRIDRDPVGPEYCRKFVRAVCAGTAPLPLNVKLEFEKKYGIEVFESYGVSEVLFVTMNMPRFQRREKSAGRVIDGIDLKILNPEGKEIHGEDEGEIIVHSPWMMKQYLDFENNNPISYKPMDSFATGDLGRRDTDGNVYITGRKKDLIIRGGLNISPRVIEETLLEMPSIAQAAIIGVPHDHLGEEIVAVLQFKKNFELEIERFAILKYCREKLSGTSVPTRLLSFDNFPVGSTGKILKRQIKEEVLRRLAEEKS